MRSISFACLLLVAACTSTTASTGIRSQDEYVSDEEKAAEEQEKKSKANPYIADSEQTDMEKKKEWDEHQAQLELARAARSAATCPSSLPEEEQKKVEKGVAKFSLVFKNDGHVKEATLQPPYADTPVGKCMLRAMLAVIVPAYAGSEHSIDWEVDLAEKPVNPTGTTDKAATDKGTTKKPAAKK
ncbi:MAG TPA: hypothetical protein VGJ84_18195 [Polyangiaceae bacterium]|jgi:hypothetical protein